MLNMLKFMDRELKTPGERIALYMQLAAFIVAPINLGVALFAPGHGHTLQIMLLSAIVWILIAPCLIISIRRTRKLKREIAELDKRIQKNEIKLIVLEFLKELHVKLEAGEKKKLGE